MNKLFIFMIFPLFLMNSCNSVEVQKKNEEKKQPTKIQKSINEMKNIQFKKIENANIDLELVSHLREFQAGKPVKLTFRLRNYSIKPLLVYEWMMKESNNLKIYYIPWKEKMKKPDKKDWKEIIPDCPENVKRTTLELAHRNYVLIDKDLPFVEKMKLKEAQSFVVYAELNLNSISAKSRLFKIKVKP